MRNGDDVIVCECLYRPEYCVYKLKPRNSWEFMLQFRRRKWIVYMRCSINCLRLAGNLIKYNKYVMKFSWFNQKQQFNYSRMHNAKIFNFKRCLYLMKSWVDTKICQFILYCTRGRKGFQFDPLTFWNTRNTLIFIFERYLTYFGELQKEIEHLFLIYLGTSSRHTELFCDVHHIIQVHCSYFVAYSRWPVHGIFYLRHHKPRLT